MFLADTIAFLILNSIRIDREKMYRYTSQTDESSDPHEYSTVHVYSTVQCERERERERSRERE